MAKSYRFLLLMLLLLINSSSILYAQSKCLILTKNSNQKSRYIHNGTILKIKTTENILYRGKLTIIDDQKIRVGSTLLFINNLEELSVMNRKNKMIGFLTFIGALAGAYASVNQIRDADNGGQRFFGGAGLLASGALGFFSFSAIFFQEKYNFTNGSSAIQIGTEPGVILDTS